MDPDSILALVTQLKALADEAKGLPKNQKEVPKGVIPANEGSSFVNNDVTPILTPNERKRCEQIADIFAAAFRPQSETGEKLNMPRVAGMPQTVEHNVSLGEDFKKQADGSGIMGIISGILGIGGAAGSVAAVPTILAGAASIAGIMLAIGPSVGLMLMALQQADEVDWEAVDKGAKTLQSFAYVGMDFLKMLHQMGLDTIKTIFEIARTNFDSISVSLGKLGVSIREFKDVEWEDMGKAVVALGGLLGTIALAGSPVFAIFGALGGLIMQLQAASLTMLGTGLTNVSVGFNDLLTVIKAFDDLDAVTLGVGLANMLGTISTISIAGVQAPLAAFGAIASQMAGWGLEGLAAGVAAFGNSANILVAGVARFETLDSRKLGEVARSIRAIGGSLLSYSASGFASSIAGAFSSLFGSDSFDKFLQLADKSTQLQSAADSITALKDAFKEFTALRTDDLMYNLEKITNAVNDLDLDKLQKIYATPGNAIGGASVVEMRKIREYLLYGVGGSESGLIEVNEQILEVDRQQLKILTDMKNMMMESRTRALQIEQRNQGSKSLQSDGKTRTIGGNFREEVSEIMINPFLSR